MLLSFETNPRLARGGPSRYPSVRLTPCRKSSPCTHSFSAISCSQGPCQAHREPYFHPPLSLFLVGPNGRLMGLHDDCCTNRPITICIRISTIHVEFLCVYVRKYLLCYVQSWENPVQRRQLRRKRLQRWPWSLVHWACFFMTSFHASV